MIKQIDIATFLEKVNDLTLLDVRTPAEYNNGHIPGALNLPLFSNKERAIVGTSYQQESPGQALLRGLDIVGPKMSAFIKKAGVLAPSKKIALHCWRGGKRSSSMAWLLDLSGFEVSLIEGGYKAYKRFIQKKLKQANNYIVLGGKTGSGKTKILRALQDLGEQVIDLEGMAKHKGSAFGYLGQDPQPTTEHFENLLFTALSKLDHNRRIWLENESRNIGSVYLTDGFWRQMKAAPVLNISIPFAERIDNLIEEYSVFPNEALIQAFEKIKKRLGGKNFKDATIALAEGNYHRAAEIALAYYDKSYQFLLDKNQAPAIFRLAYENQNSHEIALSLIEFCRSKSLVLNEN